MYDLSNTHRGSAWKTEPRDSVGRWTSLPGLKVRTDPNTGKHAEFKDPERRLADDYRGLSVKEERAWSTVDWDGLMKRAADPSASPTEREHAAKQVTLHLERMKRKIQSTTAESAVAVEHSRSKAVLKVKTGEQKIGHYVKDTTTDASRIALTQIVLQYAVRAAAAAAALIGAHESEHFVESLHHLTENLAVESGVNVALTLLITALVARIQKAVRERHDARIAKARGVLAP